MVARHLRWPASTRPPTSIQCPRPLQATGTTITSPDRTPYSGIPDCNNEIYIATPCYDLAYSPNTNAAANAIIAQIKANNVGRVIPDGKVIGFASVSDAEVYMAANYRTIQTAVHFFPVRGHAEGTVKFSPPDRLSLTHLWR